MASAARKDFERFECLASAAKRCSIAESSRMVRVSVIVFARFTQSRTTKYTWPDEEMRLSSL
jgi:hypothetical protein